MGVVCVVHECGEVRCEILLLGQLVTISRTVTCVPTFIIQVNDGIPLLSKYEYHSVIKYVLRLIFEKNVWS